MSSGDLITKSIDGIWVSHNENTDTHYADYLNYIKPLLTDFAAVNLMTTSFHEAPDENYLAIVTGADKRIRYMKNPLAAYGHIDIFGSDEFAQDFIAYMNAY